MAKSKEDYKKEIKDYRTSHPNGQHTHQVISFSLQECADKLGKKVANDIIDELRLPFQKAVI